MTWKHCVQHGIPMIPVQGLQVSLFERRLRRSASREEIDRFVQYVRDNGNPKLIARKYCEKHVTQLLWLVDEDGFLTRYLEKNNTDLTSLSKILQSRRADQSAMSP